MSAVFAVAFVALVVLSFPIAHALVIGTTAAMLVEGQPLFAAVQQMYTPIQNFPMIAIPFFIMAAELMMSGELGKNLIDFATDLVGRFRGGHAQVSVLGSTLFGGVSGSAIADASALGALLIPWQVKQGYPKAFCGATIAAASTIDILIPPSIPMILYSLVSNASIASLFVAGVLPGLLVAAGFLAVCNVSARLRGFPYDRQPMAWGRMARRALYAAPALAMPVLVLVALRFGVITPTEVSTCAVLYALIVSVFFYRDLTWKRFKSAIYSGGVATGVVMLLIMASTAAGWMLTVEEIPQQFLHWAQRHLTSADSVLMLMNGMLLFTGMFIELPAAILLLTPLFLPLAHTFHIDLVQLGIVMFVNLAIGLYTPPIGATMIIGSMLSRSSIGAMVKELLPFYLWALIVLVLMTYIPALTIY